jgi:DNA-directed RNA polymerase specialized sigma24 family protein
VKPDDSLRAAGVDRFRTTQWSVVLLSAQSQAAGSEAALAELCRLYWYPLYGFVRRRGYHPDDARDLTQGFFLHLLEHKTLTHIDPSKGKFRSFLLASLQKYLTVEATRARCLKRGGAIEFVFLDAKSAEDRYQLEPLDTLTPEIIFDARWAMALLGEAKSRLAQEYAADGKTSTFETLKPFLDVENKKESPSYETTANILRIGVGAVKSLIHRLRGQYTALVREEIARTVPDALDIDAEIHDLCEALIAAEGRVLP